MSEGFGLGVVIAAVGTAAAWAGTEFSINALIYGGTIVIIFGGLVIKGSMVRYYCENCGQKLGKEKPDCCSRCGSNRITTQDPGAGKAVRVKDR